MVSFWCYVLKLQNSCFYIGISREDRIEKRINQHFRGDGGSKWCFLHHPLEVLSKKRFPGPHNGVRRRTTVDHSVYENPRNTFCSRCGCFKYTGGLLHARKYPVLGAQTIAKGSFAWGARRGRSPTHIFVLNKPRCGDS